MSGGDVLSVSWIGKKNTRKFITVHDGIFCNICEILQIDDMCCLVYTVYTNELDRAYYRYYAWSYAVRYSKRNLWKGVTMPAAGSYQPATISLVDAGAERTSVRFFGKIITAANHDAQIALWSGASGVVDSVMAVVLGAKRKTFYGDGIYFLWDTPTNGAAREIALEVQMKDATTGELFTYRLPTVDPTIPDYVINNQARDTILLTSPASIVDLLTALDAFCVNPEIPANALTSVGLRVVRGFK